MFNETPLGFEYVDSKKLVFFGKKEASIEQIQKYYSKFKFQFIRQTHSNILIKASDQFTEADAHYTAEVNSALLIKTADCLPVMIYDKDQKQVLAIHAGWRGVANRITFSSINDLQMKNLEIYIGPHIMLQSFEVDEPVMLQLVQSTAESKDQMMIKNNNKYYLNLQKIVMSQINEVTKNYQLKTMLFDTVESEIFNSYRRDKTDKRNLNFIALIN